MTKEYEVEHRRQEWAERWLRDVQYATPTEFLSSTMLSGKTIRACTIGELAECLTAVNTVLAIRAFWRQEAADRDEGARTLLSRAIETRARGGDRTSASLTPEAYVCEFCEMVSTHGRPQPVLHWVRWQNAAGKRHHFCDSECLTRWIERQEENVLRGQ